MGKNTLVVSDLHLTPKFNKRKFNYLKKLFQKADRIIVNGDLWCYYYCNFADFLKSEWRKLFPVMLEKGCIYIHGNHDRKKWCNENTRLFSVATYDRYSFKQNGNTFNIQHGHLILNKPIRNETFIKYLKKYRVAKPYYALQNIIINKLGYNIYNIIGVPYNKGHKKYHKKFIPNGEFLVCGHSHLPEGSLERGYINTGFIDYGSSSYLLINDKISLVKESY